MKARAKLMDQACKALYCLYRKLRNISIPIDLQFKLFDTLILPILTYGCEILGYENTKQIEKLHLQFCRNIVGPKKKIYVFTVTRPTLIFASDPMHFYTEFG